MAIVATDILFRLTGGSGNSSQNASLGGVMSTSTVASASLFDDVSGAESAAGESEYRGVALLNNHGSLSYLAPRVWISTDTPASDTDADVALAAEAVNTTMATIATEDTAPATVTFANTAISYATGLVIPDIPFSQFKGIWIKRNITAGANASADSFTVSVQGDTNP
jgi:hypothetical protein